MLTSLRELRAIEDQRLADEHAAREAAVAAQRRAREVAAQAARDAQAAQLREQREGELAAERARDAAERAARLQLEATQAAERARQQIELDQRRLIEEVALRREVARRQRPRWMLATTAIAVGIAIGFGGFAITRAHDARAALVARDRAIEQRTQAEDAARVAQAELAQLRKEVVEMRDKIQDAIDHTTRVRTVTELREAEAQLQRVLHERHLLQQRQDDHLEDVERNKRRQPIQISKDCLTNVICN